MKRFAVASIAVMLVASALWLSREAMQFSQKPTAHASLEKGKLLMEPAHSSQVGTGPRDEKAFALADTQAQAKALLGAAYSTPINFWGKAVDESGQPVSGASVHLVASDKYFGDGSSYSATTDVDGLFSLTGSNGLSLSVRVEKPGYYLTENESRATIGFGYRTASKAIRPPPTKEQPTVFVLRKANPSKSLVKSKGWRLQLPQDGTPIGIRLEGVNNLTNPSQAHLTFETHLDLARISDRNEFPWRCRISVPGGGLIERTDILKFEAPETGYRPEEAITMTVPVSETEPWRSGVERDFFLKLPNGTFGRVHISIRMSDLDRNNTVYFEGAWDPTGARSLEIGPDEHGNPL